MFAQALGEYGVAQRVFGGLEMLMNEGALLLREGGPTVWVGIAVVVFVLFFFLRRR